MNIQYPAAPDPRIRWWPAVYDCISDLVTERCGYPRRYLEASSLAFSLYGTDSPSLVSLDMYLKEISQLAEISSRPILADLSAPDESPMQTAAAARRIFRAGASLLLLELSVPLCSVWEEHVKAVLAERIPLAVVFRYSGNMDADTAQCRRAQNLGAALVGIRNLPAELFTDYAEAVPGRKLLFPDAERRLPVPDELLACGYTDVILDFAKEGTVTALRHFAERTMQDQNTVYHDQHDFDGRLCGHDYHDIFDFGNRWIALEQRSFDSAKAADTEASL
jgi:hypothetical protein